MRHSGQTSFAERAGGFLGRLWRTYRRSERRGANWLVTQGLPGAAVVVLLWGVRLGVIVVLFHMMPWLGLLIIFGAVVVSIVRNSDPVETELPQAEWRYGQAGYGLYSSDEYRIDPHDPEDE